MIGMVRKRVIRSTRSGTPSLRHQGTETPPLLLPLHNLAYKERSQGGRGQTISRTPWPFLLHACAGYRVLDARVS